MVHGGGSGNHTKPVVEYVVDGRRYEITGIISSSPSAYSVRDKAVVHYIPDDPADAQVSSFVERWLFLLIFGGLGVTLGCVALAGLRLREVSQSLSSP